MGRTFVEEIHEQLIIDTCRPLQVRRKEILKGDGRHRSLDIFESSFLKESRDENERKAKEVMELRNRIYWTMNQIVKEINP
jgi:hypothetical protein